ncbi:flagellar basal body rod protein FlgC [Aureimonas phyllosphaerae]|uniref:Flagellar basal-body rod protein FlgC n=1 Tax=Aureimonas phyllosphaerae TaxID=1166078 RepID=A0A7W6BXL8_9HYPH|nr:flagellar basal body rod protein FlgC [Aureimonas phyllosphaerae]MBB3935576.1 flagellar basal-body rod protein FlgC [Aureimonas phyllosphaerae]MBB3959584.1 flagellar basal-body rod protein FlgC [Aureimonas phyllosphaerae]SFF12482.1 flagellar basal-body rod protein FlgC [Aureimonas phyllosphaerae]
MTDSITSALKIAASGLEAQSERMRIVSENVANARSTGETPGSDPYRRKTVAFTSEMDRLLGADLVRIKSVGTDRSDFRMEHDPGNPAADKDGYVKMPNVNMLVEMTDMREANRSYEANLQVIKQARELINLTIDLMRG